MIRASATFVDPETYFVSVSVSATLKEWRQIMAALEKGNDETWHGPTYDFIEKLREISRLVTTRVEKPR